MGNRKIVLVLISSVLLSACGGGGSSSGGSDVADKNVTRCINAERVTISFSPGSEAQYTKHMRFLGELSLQTRRRRRRPNHVKSEWSAFNYLGLCSTRKFHCMPPTITRH